MWQEILVVLILLLAVFFIAARAYRAFSKKGNVPGCGHCPANLTSDKDPVQ
jgi:hypothetical protein